MLYHFKILLLTLLLHATSAIQAQATLGFSIVTKEKSVTIPVEIYYNLVVIPIKINNTVEVNFILDTGSKSTIIVEPLILNVLGLSGDRKVRVQGLGSGDVIYADFIPNVELSLAQNKVVGKNINLVSIPEGLINFSEMIGQPVYGIIGSDLFINFEVQINYENKFIKIYKRGTYRSSKKDKILPLKILGNKPYCYLTANNNELSKQELFLIDTGASQAVTILNDSSMLPNNKIKAYLGRGLSGEIYGHQARLQLLSISNLFLIENSIASFPDINSFKLSDSKVHWYGNIGGELLNRFTVTFDYHNKQMYWCANQKIKKDFNYNISGIQVITEGSNYDIYRISHVRKSSAAYKVGLRENDQIKALKGVNINDTNINKIYSALNKKAGKKIKIKIKRQEKALKFKFILIDELKT